jgi:hypothetical protein
VVKNALLGFIICIACLIPPLIHFISGPLGPLIGGWFAGSKSKSSIDQSILIGSTMGGLSILPIVLASVFGPSILPIENFYLGGSLTIILTVILLSYVTILGSIGAAIGGHMARKQNNDSK